MLYCHKQTARYHLVVPPVMALVLVVFAVAPWRDGHFAPIVLGVAGAAAVCLLAVVECFQSLTVRDAGDCLLLQFGPIPLIKKRFPYSQMTAVAAGRSTFLDGWGIHYSPRGGWIYNVWGRDCVRIEIGGKPIRIGTDDVEGLVKFLEAKIQATQGTQPQ